MTEQEMVGVVNALETVGLVYNKFPKKIEVKIPRAKFPGIYLSIPLEGKTFKLQVYCHQSSFAFIDKLSTKGYTFAAADLDKTFSITEVKGIPAEEEVVEYLNQALETVVKIGIVRPPVVEEPVVVEPTATTEMV